MLEFLNRAEKMAQNDTPLLLLGETGVGKSRAARWMHDISSREKKEFFALDGRAHEEDNPFLERSLSKVGTIFIAEIFSLPRRLQDRLIEILAEGKVRIIGSSSSSPEFQQKADLREDLVTTLSAHSLKVPSLHERAEDLEALVRDILSSLAQKMKLKALDIDPPAFRKLQTYGFPGNVKELERILERGAIEAKAGVITKDSLHFQSPDLKQLLPFAIPVEDGWNRLEVLRDSLERELILRALEKYPDLSNTQIANVLGTTRRILELRMKAYQIRETSS